VKARRVVLVSVAVISGLSELYMLVVRGALTLDVGIGRRVRSLGPIESQMEANPETVFDIVAAPYLGKTPHGLSDKLRVVERGSDMVLAEHFTSVGWGLQAVTVETVRFDRPGTISFRLVRGPVPHVIETFELQPKAGGTALVYTGEMAADFWALGAWWAEKVARKWEQAVEASIASIKAEAERRARPPSKAKAPSTAKAPSKAKAPSRRSPKTVDE
jgi:hypothetical protein